MIRRFRIFFCSNFVISASISLAERNAVSPDVIGHAMTPTIARIPPIGMALLVDFKLFASESSPFPKPVIWMVFVAAIIWLCVYLYVFPVLARFVNTVKGTLKNAFFMSILGLPRTAVMIVATVLPAFCFIFAPATTWKFLPIFLCFGITVPGYICAWLYSPLFKKFEGESQDKDDQAVEVDESEYEEAASILHDEDDEEVVQENKD